VPVELLAGALFAREYQIERLLGQGGMGSVYAARHLPTGTPCAIKLMRAELVRDAKLRERFELETKVTARIQSEHVVRVLAAGVDEATRAPWLAMELLEGEDLAHFAGRSGLTAAQTRHLFAQLGAALGAAHAAGVVHRDLKPENLFVGRGGRLKVLDFGIAKIVSESLPMETRPIGSMLWMAPEQAEARSTVSPATDLWAAALLAFWILTGRYYWTTPYADAGSVPRMLREVLFDPLETATVRAASFGGAARLPAGFDAWFGRCVARPQTARFADTREAFAELDRVLGQLPARSPRATHIMSAVAMAPTATPAVAPLPLASGPLPSMASTVPQSTAGALAPPSQSARWVPWGIGGIAALLVAMLVMVTVVVGAVLWLRRTPEVPGGDTPDPAESGRGAPHPAGNPLLGGGGTPTIDVSGRWAATWGSGADTHGITVTLVQTSNEVSGDYTGDSRGTVSGTMDGTVLRGRWVEGGAASQQGPVEWKFDADGRGFTGRYDSDDRRYGGAMTGRRN
jgi:serine/threonine protein kinase